MQIKVSKEDSLKKRYFFKLATNLIGVPISMVTESIIPRGLGVNAYGDFSFLTNFFISTTSFIDLGTSNAFYNKISKRPNEHELRRFYWNMVSVLSVLLIFFVFISIVSGFQSQLWPDQTLKHIVMALFFGYLYWYSQIILKIVDAYALTKGGELIRMAQKILRLLLILPMYFLGWFSLDMFFLYNYFIILFSIIGWILILKKHNIQVVPTIRLTKNNLKIYLEEFYHYSAPLVVFSFVGMIAGIFDRWILQFSAGSVEQGYYGLAYQIGTISFIFTSAMTPLIFREFSIEIAKKNFKEVRKLFRRHIPMLYAIAAFFGIFISFHAESVGLIIGGENFKGAYWPIVIMSIYPIHQTYGQLSGTLFYASDNTRLYKNIGISVLLSGIPVSYILISKNDIFGLNLGGIGLSLKMVIIQFIQVNVQLWYNTKFLNTKFSYYFIHQIYTVLFFSIAAIMSKIIIDLFLINQIINFIVSGVLYTIFVVIIAVVYPSIFALKRVELNKFYTEFKNRIKTV